MILSKCLHEVNLHRFPTDVKMLPLSFHTISIILLFNEAQSVWDKSSNL